MKFNKIRLARKKILLIIIICIFFSFIINFFIDFYISSEPYVGKDFYYYVRFNVPIIVISAILNFIFVLCVNATFLKNFFYIKLPVEFLFVFLLCFVQIYFFVLLYYDDFVFFETIAVMIDSNLIFVNMIENLILMLFSELLYYIIKEKDNADELNRFEIENNIYKYKLLKSQINPHFLFNSLNILAAMVYKKKDFESGEYIEKLSDVYRYVLTNEENKIIKLQLEMDFIHKYIEILKSRFREGLVFEIDISKNSLDKYVPTMSLQLLIENCIKHNIVSKEHPLIINIYSQGDYVIVSNNKNIREENCISTGIGLNNLNQRYELIANKRIEVNDNNEIYKVKIPLI